MGLASERKERTRRTSFPSKSLMSLTWFFICFTTILARDTFGSYFALKWFYCYLVFLFVTLDYLSGRSSLIWSSSYYYSRLSYSYLFFFPSTSILPDCNPIVSTSSSGTLFLVELLRVLLIRHMSGDLYF